MNLLALIMIHIILLKKILWSRSCVIFKLFLCNVYHKLVYVYEHTKYSNIFNFQFIVFHKNTAMTTSTIASVNNVIIYVY